MALDVKNFLTQYFMQLHFNNMPVEVRTSFISANNSAQLTKDMLGWMNGVPQDPLSGAPEIKPLIPYISTITPPKPDLKNWANTMLNRDLPDPNEAGGHAELSDDEWKKLFSAFQVAMRAMAGNKKSFSDNNKALAFLDEHFGAGKLFDVGQLSAATNTAVSQFAAFLHNNSYEQGLKIHNALVAAGQSPFNSIAEFKEFSDNLVAGKHNTDSKVREKLEKLSQIISGNWDFFESKGVDYSAAPGLTNETADQIANNLEEDNSVQPYKLSQFKRDYGNLLGTLYKDGKVLEVFSQYDNGKISGPLKTAKEKINYDNKESENYLAPKRDDELNLAQQISKWCGDTYEDCLKKYITLRGDRLYVSPDAKLIVKAFDKAEIKPTDGLAKVVAGADKIKAGLPPVARKKFEYFAATMKDLQVTMPKAFDGALRNGRQLRAIVSEMIISAIRNGKAEEAKVAMEVLSVIKYGFTTSKIIEALRKENFTIFSDSKLSWNKNDGMKFVMTALDKGLRTAFLGAGYGITIVNNTIQRSRSKFSGDLGRMNAAHKDWKETHDQRKISLEYSRDKTIADSTKLHDNLSKLGTKGGVNAGNITTKRADLDGPGGIKERAETAKTDFEAAETAFNDNASRAAALPGEITALRNKRNDLRKEIRDIDNEIATLNTKLATYTGLTDAVSVAEATELVRRINKKEAEKQVKEKERNDPTTGILKQIADKQAEQTTKTDPAHIATLASDRDAEQINYENMRKAEKRERNKIEYFDEATQTVSELHDSIINQQDAIDNWDNKDKDMYLDLMAHWDFLESGATKSHAPGRASAKQKEFDTKKTVMIDSFKSGYSIT